MKSKYILSGIFLIALIGLPLLLLANQSNQDSRSRASASSQLFFAPTTTASSPTNANVGDMLSFDVMIDPGGNLPSVVKMEFNFDPGKIQVGQNGFAANTNAFPTTLEGPVLTEGKLSISLSIGSDTTKAIQKLTKVGTLTIKTIGKTDASPTEISFGSSSMILSIGSTDHANENVLSTFSPAYISVGETTTPSITTTPSSTTLSVTAFLHGIGNSGDNANPNNSTLSNKTPAHAKITATTYLFDSQNKLVASAAGDLTYDPNLGNFSGDISVDQPIASGVYIVLVKTSNHLRRMVPGVQKLAPMSKNTMPEISLIAGDINDDNQLNILDYNFILGCYSDLEPAKACNDESKIVSDLNDDGPVNQVDYNLFLRELSTQNGN